MIMLLWVIILKVRRVILLRLLLLLQTSLSRLWR